MIPFPDRCNAIINFRVPISRIGIRFMGMVRYYQRFCPNLAKISQPLTKLLHKEANSNRNWGLDQKQTIQQVKHVPVPANASTLQSKPPNMSANFNPNL